MIVVRLESFLRAFINDKWNLFHDKDYSSQHCYSTKILSWYSTSINAEKTWQGNFNFPSHEFFDGNFFSLLPFLLVGYSCFKTWFLLMCLEVPKSNHFVGLWVALTSPCVFSFDVCFGFFGSIIESLNLVCMCCKQKKLWICKLFLFT